MSDTTRKPGKALRPPPDVQCSHRKCSGARHDPTCPVYVWAVGEWAPPIPTTAKEKKPRKRGRHPAETGERRLTKEERDEITRTNGMKGGAPRSELPVDLLKILRKGKFRIKDEFKRGDEISEAAAGVAGYALERLAYVAAGRVSHRKAPSVVKAAQAIREEICEPIEKSVSVKGGLNLGLAVEAAAERAGLTPPKEQPALPAVAVPVIVESK